MRSDDPISSNGQRLFEAFKKIKKTGMRIKHSPNLRPSEMMMLHYIYHRLKNKEKAEGSDAAGNETAGVTISELSEFVGQTSSAVSQTVKSLEEKGYAVRTFCPSDRRVVLVTVSAEGQQFLKEEEKAFLDYLDRITDALGEEDTNRLIELLEKFAEVLPTIEK